MHTARVAVVVLALLPLSFGSDACLTVNSSIPAKQLRHLDPWLRVLSADRPLINPESYPFCFLYDGVPSSALLPAWNFETHHHLLNDRHTRELTWTEPGGGLAVTISLTQYHHMPNVSDAILRLSNTGDAPSGVVTRLRSLTVDLHTREDEPARLYSRVGGDGGPYDYQSGASHVPGPPVWLTEKKPVRLANRCGTASYGTLPWFQLEWPHTLSGLVFSLGWAGQWEAQVSRGTNGISIAAGVGGEGCDGVTPVSPMSDEYPAFSVLPGEAFRGMRVVIIAYSAEHLRDLHQTGLNLHRRLVLDALAPRANPVGGWPWDRPEQALLGPGFPLISAIHSGWHTGNWSQNMQLLENIERVRGIEEAWFDVGWAAGGFAGDWALPPNASVSTALYNSTHTFASVLHAARESTGVQTTVWFMSEMNQNSSTSCPGFGIQCPANPHDPGSFLWNNHNDWLSTDNSTMHSVNNNFLINFGNPSALSWTVKYLSEAIERWGIDTYRIESSCLGGHDCVNFFKAYDNTYQAHTHPGIARNGTSELGHVAGLLSLFHQLRERHPGLMVDVCAGGGRRVDVDIMSTSVQKWQSDYATVGPYEHVQGQLMGEQHFQPLSATGMTDSTPYVWRSGSTTGGLIFWDQINDTVAMRVRTSLAIAETKRLRPLVLQGDFFHLSGLDQYGWSNITADNTTWAAWQWGLPSGEAGAALFFRRAAAPAGLHVELQLIDAERVYVVRYFYGYLLHKKETYTGAELKSLRVEVPLEEVDGESQPASLLIEYELED